MRQVQPELGDLWHGAVVAGDGAFAEQSVAGMVSVKPPA
jgi:hypothetical protein